MPSFTVLCAKFYEILWKKTVTVNRVVFLWVSIFYNIICWLKVWVARIYRYFLGSRQKVFAGPCYGMEAMPWKEMTLLSQELYLLIFVQRHASLGSVLRFDEQQLVFLNVFKDSLFVPTRHRVFLHRRLLSQRYIKHYARARWNALINIIFGSFLQQYNSYLPSGWNRSTQKPTAIKFTFDV